MPPLVPPIDVVARIVYINGSEQMFITWTGYWLAGWTCKYTVWGNVQNWSSVPNVNINFEVGDVPCTDDSEASYMPSIAGHYRFKVMATYTFDDGSGNIITQVTPYSAQSAPIYYPSIDYSLPTPLTPMAVMDTIIKIDITVPVPEISDEYDQAVLFGRASTELVVYFGEPPGVVKSAALVTLAPGVNTYSYACTPGQTYYFTAQYHILNTNIYSPISAPSEYIRVPGTLAPPASVSASFISPTVVNLDWIDATYGEALYEIWRIYCTGPDRVLVGNWVKLAEVGRETTNFVDSNASIGQGCRYGVVARAGSYTSIISPSQFLPEVLPPPVASYSNYDVDLSLAYINFHTPPMTIHTGIQSTDFEDWQQWNRWPYSVHVLYSYDNINFTAGALQYYNAISSPIGIPVPQGRTVYAKVVATNGAGTVYSNLVEFIAVPQFFTPATPPVYEAGKTISRSLVWGLDGAGEADYALTGFSNYDNLKYAATKIAIGTLDKEPTDIELLSQPFGKEWYGGKTVYSVEVDATANRDVFIEVGSRDNYKDEKFDLGREVVMHKTGRVGYIKAGREFEVCLKWRSGVPDDVKFWGLRLWLKLTGRQGLNTIPIFYGRRGFNPKGAE